LLARLAETPAAQTLRARLEGGGVCPLGSVTLAAAPCLAALLHRWFPDRAILAVLPNLKAQETFHQDWQTWLSPEPAGGNPGGDGAVPRTDPAPPLFYPAWESLPHEGRLPHADVISERLETLVALASPAPSPAHPAPRVTASVTALLQRTFPPERLRDRLRLLGRGDTADPLDLIEWLEAQAYEPESQVTQKGELALRGGILDVYPLSSPWPARLEFFGTTLESLRYFDPHTQISRQEIDRLVLPPAGELGLLRQQPDGLASLLDYLRPDALLLCVEPDDLAAQAGAYAAQVPAADPFFIDWGDWRARAQALAMTRIDLTELEPGDGGLRFPLASLDAFRPVADRAPDPTLAETQRRIFFDQLNRWSRRGWQVHVFCNNDGERQRLLEVWRDAGFPGPPATHLGAFSRGFLCEPAGLVVVTDAEIFGRYRVQRPRRLKSPHAAAVRSAFDIDFTDLAEGDYVVHLQYGIGRYLGLQRLGGAARGGGEAAGIAPARARPTGEECLAIEYAPADPGQPAPRLYVPITEAHLVGKYIGAGKGRPPLNTLSGTRWQKAKTQAAEAVRDLAADLLRLQAARAAQPGFAFPPDAPWQREFESAFVYEETPDQQRAIEATKRDLELSKPMDRLICGDVGFGKTEVAIRAAFKAVLAGRQVAVLVPTTVLAQQHYNTFRERMADYPVRVELLSRFRTRRQQDRVIEGLAKGTVDIVIGTHRLVQPDITFKDLGLVVIDEEQRFGVLHKERLKHFRQMVDVLTLSATPIPRTLHLALSGARDLSTIETPPQDRLPVETTIAPYDERLVRDAIRRELNRGGQVFYLHNRIADIEAVALRLRALVPQARIGVGHGQMQADDLEDVMTRFVNGELDVLLSTTIIESGIDIPNANTILIDRADRFGLADLYQLRGRVGRYKHQAYAYLLIPRHAGVLADARKRINAVKQFSSPGSGFRIAMRDLEIRGAGNLLGAEQSGHIAAVGFELYCHLLKQSVAALQGKPVPPAPQVAVRLDFLDLNPAGHGPADPVRPGGSPDQPDADDPLPVAVPRQVASCVREPAVPDAAPREAPAVALAPAPAGLPLAYVPEARHRLEMYRKLALASDTAALAAIQAELRDRFGPPPPAVDLLLRVAHLKLLATARAVTAIETRDDKLLLTRAGDFVQVGGRFPRLTRRTPNARLGEIRRLLLALAPAP
jgi:transcription-repair coupling factor (superfamily II helicase)